MIGVQWFHKQSQDSRCHSERYFTTQFLSGSMKNIIRVLLCRFQHCLGAFDAFPVEGCSETRLFTHLSNYVFRSPQFRKYISYEGHLFVSKCFKFDVDLRNAEKNGELFFPFLSSWNWIGCSKFSVLGIEILPSAVNVVTNSLRISDITKRDNFELNFLQIDDKLWYKCSCSDFSSVSHSLTSWLSKDVLKRGFLDI